MRRLALALCLVALGCDPEPTYRAGDIAHHKLLGGLDARFMLGTATSSHQIEGGIDDDWAQWERGSFPDGSPHIRDGASATPADDSWSRWPDDLDAMKILGANAYRMGVDWARLQRAPGAALDPAGVAHYRAELSALRAAGIRPVVTLYHFSLPRWAGGGLGWDSDDTLDQLGDFAGKAAAAFGDLVDEWITVNEPNVLATEGWLKGDFPPGKKGDQMGMANALRRMIEAHAKAFAALKANDTVDADGDGLAARVGLAHHVRIFEPATGSPLDVQVAGLTDEFFNASVPSAIKTGRIRLSIPGAVKIDKPVPGLQGSLDFLGINYYTRDFLRADPTDPSLSVQLTPADRPKSDLGWDVYPEGLERSLVRFGRYGWPILVTENGISTLDDAQRADFIRAHLYALDRARAEGVKVVGYLHWSLLDNFEWAQGYHGHFGLFAVEGLGDPAGSLRRVPRPHSVAVFQEAARNLGLTPH